MAMENKIRLQKFKLAMETQTQTKYGKQSMETQIRLKTQIGLHTHLPAE